MLSHGNLLTGLDLQLQNNFAAGYLLGAVATFGDNVQRLRRAAGLKGKELAEKIGVQPPTVSGWEHNRTGLPETPTLLKLAKAMRCSVDDLLNGIDLEYDEQRQASNDEERARSAAAAPGVHDLEARVADYEATLREVEDIAKRLTRIAAFGGKGRAPRGAESKGSGRDRKAG